MIIHSSVHPSIYSSVIPFVHPFIYHLFIQSSIYPSSIIHLFICPSSHPSICPSCYLSIHPFVHSFIYHFSCIHHPLVYPSIHPLFRLYIIHLSVHALLPLIQLSMCPSIHLSTRPSSIHPVIHQSIWLPVHPTIHSFIRPPT